MESLFGPLTESNPARPKRGGSTKRGASVACSHCAATFYAKNSRIAKATKLYCSKACLAAAKPKRVVLACETCGKEYDRAPSQIVRPGQGKFCSRDCKDASGRTAVRCYWPGCCTELIGRRRVHSKLGPVWKIDFTRGAREMRWPICQEHRDLADRHLPKGHRLVNGNQKWFEDPDAVISDRGVTAKVTQLLIWSKTSGNCAHCNVSLDFMQKPRRWQCDHIVPVYKDGKTTLTNMQALCGPCHDKKSSFEKSEVSRLRHERTRLNRWLTHPEKDKLIESLRAEIEILRAERDALLGAFNGHENLCRRDEVSPKGPAVRYGNGGTGQRAAIVG